MTDRTAKTIDLIAEMAASFIKAGKGPDNNISKFDIVRVVTPHVFSLVSITRHLPELRADFLKSDAVDAMSAHFAKTFDIEDNELEEQVETAVTLVIDVLDTVIDIVAFFRDLRVK